MLENLVHTLVDISTTSADKTMFELIPKYFDLGQKNDSVRSEYTCHEKVFLKLVSLKVASSLSWILLIK